MDLARSHDWLMGTALGSLLRICLVIKIQTDGCWLFGQPKFDNVRRERENGARQRH